MFRFCSTAIVVAAFAFAGWTAQAQDKDKKQDQKPPASPTDTITETIGKDGPQIKIVYSRPFTKHPETGEVRKIWGGLVPWGKAWRLGANMATALETTGDLKLGSANVPAGKYTMYMLPEEKGISKLAISKTTGQKGEPVDDKNDLARVDLNLDSLDKSVDQFTIAVSANKEGNGGTLKFMWEKTQYSVPFTVTKK